MEGDDFKRRKLAHGFKGVFDLLLLFPRGFTGFTSFKGILKREKEKDCMLAWTLSGGAGQ